MRELQYINREEASRRMSFRDTIRCLTKIASYNLYYNLDKHELYNRKFQMIGAIYIDNLPNLKEDLLSYSLNVTEFVTEHYQGVYFTAGSGEKGLIVAPKKEMVSLDPSIFNQGWDALVLNEIIQYGTDNNINDMALIDENCNIPLWALLELVVAERMNIPFEQASFVRFENSRKEYVQHYLNYKNDKRPDFNGKTALLDRIEDFSRIYFQEIKIISENIEEKNISIHDVGTNIAQFPLLIASLNEKELFNKNFYRVVASDYGWSAEDFVSKSIKNNGMSKKIEFMKLDITGDINLCPETDVIIINDVLEHLPDEITSLNALKALWSRTGKLLIAHVPIEEQAARSMGHNMTFDSEKIRKWAAQLCGSCFLSDKYFETDGQTFSAHGYLIVKKC